MDSQGQVQLAYGEGQQPRSQFAVNWGVYHSPGVERSYTSRTLSPAETLVLLKYQPCFAGRAVLDIGVGTGRTTSFLQPLAGRYACLDYSPAMVRRARQAFPEADVRLLDMRDLSPWPPGTFHFVLASSNVLDAVSHEDRLATLIEIRRVLAPDGVFVFSSHNRRYRLAGHGPQLELSRNPITQMLMAGRYLHCLRNHRRLSAHRRQAADYALFDDPGHDFALIHYYIAREHQAAQLAGAGFQPLEVIDRNGHALDADEDDAANPNLIYVARAA